MKVNSITIVIPAKAGIYLAGSEAELKKSLKQDPEIDPGSLSGMTRLRMTA